MYTRDLLISVQCAALLVPGDELSFCCSFHGRRWVLFGFNPDAMDEHESVGKGGAKGEVVAERVVLR